MVRTVGYYPNIQFGKLYTNIKGDHALEIVDLEASGLASVRSVYKCKGHMFIKWKGQKIFIEIV